MVRLPAVRVSVSWTVVTPPAKLIALPLPPSVRLLSAVLPPTAPATEIVPASVRPCGPSTVPARSIEPAVRAVSAVRVTGSA